MATLNLSGNIANANGASTTISIIGPNGYAKQFNKKGNFSLTSTDLGITDPGKYAVSFDGFTDGTLTVNLTGSIISISPNSPQKLTSNFHEIFNVILN